MESEGSLPQPQVPTTCPYPEPVRSSPHSHIPLPEDQFKKKKRLRMNIVQNNKTHISLQTEHRQKYTVYEETPLPVFIQTHTRCGPAGPLSLRFQFATLQGNRTHITVYATHIFDKS